MSSNKIKVFSEYLTMASYGDTFMDRIAILQYTLRSITHPVLKAMGIRPSRFMFKDVTLNMGKYKMFCGKSISNAWIVSDFFEDDLERYIDLDKGTFIDIGSNIGKYAIKLGVKLKGKGKVIAIEPEADNYVNLRKNVIINDLKEDVIPLCLGCSAQDYLAYFNVDDPDNGTGTHSMIVKRDYFTQFTPVLKLDSIVAQLGLKDIKLIKVDVEGAEDLVLMGATETLRNHHPTIVFEVWKEEDLQRIKEILKPFKYKIKKLNEENYIAK